MYKRIIYHLIKYPLIAWMALKSIPSARKAAVTPNKIVFEAPYQGQPVLLIALYQQGKLRPDLARLMLQAKEMGLYIIAVNNASLAEPANDYFDCYIERVNFGRDFGSYKTGFEYLFNLTNVTSCPRVLMINDSVYYDTSRSKQFLQQLFDTDVQVLGATENLEIEHHLGSFCISIDRNIIAHPDFRRYWADYRMTNVRLLVIYRGELGLSRCLKGCVSSPSQFRALYDLTFLETTLHVKQNINTFLTLSRRSPHLSWPKLTPSLLWSTFIKDKPLDTTGLYAADNMDSVEAYFKHALKIDDPTLSSRMETFVRDEIMAYSKVRSQIHINNAYLVHVGLPIIKLDGFYRGVFSAEDVLLICSQLPAKECDELKPLLFRKSYGGDTLFGWQKILFMWGLI